MKTMNQMKRVMAFLLVAIMTLTMGVTAFAAPATGNLTVKVNENNTLKGQTIDVYKLFDLTVNGTDGHSYTVNPDYKDTLKAVLNLDDTATDAAYFTAVKEVTDRQNFANEFMANALSATPKPNPTATSGKIGTAVQSHKFDNLDYGYYLVYQTGTEKIQSSLVSVNKTEVEVNLKGEAPSIDKVADTSTVEIGQIVKYTITGTIPDTTGYDTYTYKIKDTLSDGLDFVDVTGATPLTQNYPVTVELESTTTTPNATLSDNSNRTMVLDLSEWIHTNQSAKGKSFTVIYYAKVNKDAVVNTENSAELVYGNTPDSTTTTTPDKVVTPTYPLDINKTNEESPAKMLAGATFRLYRSEADAKATNNDAIKVSGSNGSYIVDPNATNMDMVSVDTAIKANVNLHVNGLAAGTYWLVETKAPDGYNKITAPIKVTITKSTTSELEWTLSQDGTNETDKIIDVVNTTGAMLPGTGGMGTIMFTVVGIFLILGVATSFVSCRKKEEKNHIS